MLLDVWELVLSLHHVRPGDQTQLIRLGSEHLYLLSDLSLAHPGFLCNIFI